MSKKTMIIIGVVAAICILSLVGADWETLLNQPQEVIPNFEEMERVEVYLPDMREEFDTDKLKFFEKYKDMVLVVKGYVVNNDLTKNTNVKDKKNLCVLQGGDGRGETILMKFDESELTEEVMNLTRENVVIEGILRQPEPDEYMRLFSWDDNFMDHCRLLEWSERVNRLILNFDITPAFEETKAELLQKYPFVKKIEFSVERSGTGVLENDDINFVTDVEPGTDPQAVLEYADYAVRLLNTNAQKLDETIEPSTGDSYGGLYKNVYISVLVRPEGVVNARNKYYIFDTVSARVGSTIKLEKAYRK